MMQLTAADKWILSKVNTLAKEVTENMDKYELGIAVQKVYDFIWEEFCDWYIEMVKPRLYNDDGYHKGSSTLDTEDGSGKCTETAASVYAVYHRRDLLHAAVRGRIHHDLQMAGVSQKSGILQQDEAAVEMIKEAVRGIRNVRTGMNVPPSKKGKSICRIRECKNVRNTFENGKVFFATLG